MKYWTLHVRHGQTVTTTTDYVIFENDFEPGANPIILDDRILIFKSVGVEYLLPFEHIYSIALDPPQEFEEEKKEWTSTDQPKKAQTLTNKTESSP